MVEAEAKAVEDTEMKVKELYFHPDNFSEIEDFLQTEEDEIDAPTNGSIVSFCFTFTVV